jgi:RAB6A-GEF complex partner protein 1
MDERHDVSSDAVRLLKKGIDAEDWELCKDVLRFAQSVDDTGMALRYVMKETGLVEAQNGDAS